MESRVRDFTEITDYSNLSDSDIMYLIKGNNYSDRKVNLSVLSAYVNNYLLNQGTGFRKIKNLAINGSLDIWQRGTSFSAVADAFYTADRWMYSKTGSMVHSIQKSSDVPSSSNRIFNSSLLASTTTAVSSFSSSDVCHIQTRIEGYNFCNISRKPFTVSFWVKSNKVGTYCLAARNRSDRSCIKEFSINSSNVWEYKSVSFPAPPTESGDWNFTNGIGLRVSFVLGSGSGFISSVKDSWQTGNFLATSNQINACDSTSNTFLITGVQIEEGVISTDFENRPIQEEIQLCQRYYEKSYQIDTVPGTALGTDGLGCASWSTQSSQANITNQRFKVEKRAVPSVAIYSLNTGTVNKIYGSGFSGDRDGQVGDIGVNGFTIGLTSNSPALSNLYCHWAVNSELYT